MFFCSYGSTVVLLILSNCHCSDYLLFSSSSIVLSSVFFLSRLTMTHWMALLLLCTSVMSIELRSCPRCHTTDYPFLPSVLGIISASALGVSSVVTEWILKEHRDIHMPQQTLWVYLYEHKVSLNNSWSVVIGLYAHVLLWFSATDTTTHLYELEWLCSLFSYFRGDSRSLHLVHPQEDGFVN